MTTEENYQAVKSGRSSIRQHCAGTRSVPFAFCASLMEDFPPCHADDDTTEHDTSPFMRMALHSAGEALSMAQGINLQRTIFILSSTKGDEQEPLAQSAARIATQLGIASSPIVVNNACTSGVTAIITAMRLLDIRAYDYAVVCGAEIQTLFTISGFQSLKSLSDEPCRPFDMERRGLNLGEAAATVVMTNVPIVEQLSPSSLSFTINAGAIHNDAYHITNPHPKAAAATRALNDVTSDIDKMQIGVVSVHGTATMFNDQMESIAIEQAGLTSVPLSALKGYYGHTMGAAGILETILTARALQDGIILRSLGFSERGVSGKVTIPVSEVTTDKRSFVKMISGFGGVSAAIMGCVGNGQASLPTSHKRKAETAMCSKGITINCNKDELAKQYYDLGTDYPRFHKMDVMSQLTFIAVEKLVAEYGKQIINTEQTAIILMSSHSTVVADEKFRATISRADDFFPSPSLFVRTLPNVCLGEIAIRHNMHGETSFYILSEENKAMMRTIIEATAAGTGVSNIICGWIDCPDETTLTCKMNIWKN